MPNRDIIVVGASAGGVEALKALAAGLPPGLPAAVFVVLHLSPHGPSLLPDILRWAGPLPADHAVDGLPVEPGRILVAPPDRHLLLDDGRVRLTRGPKENHARPAVDPLFRSAALAYGPRVVGVVLTGMLDDGTAGLWAVKDRGGVAVVQDPAEAPHPSMPRSALAQVAVDHVLRVADMPPVLARLAAGPAGPPAGPVPDYLRVEAGVAMEDRSLAAGLAALGEPSMFTCPECHGALLRLTAGGGGTRFRCNTGHAYTAAALVAALTEAAEDALWNGLRAVQEAAVLMRHLAAHARDAGDAAGAAAFDRKAAEAEARSEWVRRAALEHEVVSPDTLGGTAQ